VGYRVAFFEKIAKALEEPNGIRLRSAFVAVALKVRDRIVLGWRQEVIDLLPL
jgi:hypothetical protein